MQIGLVRPGETTLQALVAVIWLSRNRLGDDLDVEETRSGKQGGIFQSCSSAKSSLQVCSSFASPLVELVSVFDYVCCRRKLAAQRSSLPGPILRGPVKPVLQAGQRYRQLSPCWFDFVVEACARVSFLFFSLRTRGCSTQDALYRKRDLAYTIQISRGKFTEQSHPHWGTLLEYPRDPQEVRDSLVFAAAFPNGTVRSRVPFHLVETIRNRLPCRSSSSLVEAVPRRSRAKQRVRGLARPADGYSAFDGASGQKSDTAIAET